MIMEGKDRDTIIKRLKQDIIENPHDKTTWKNLDQKLEEFRRIDKQINGISIWLDIAASLKESSDPGLAIHAYMYAIPLDSTDIGLLKEFASYFMQFPPKRLPFNTRRLRVHFLARKLLRLEEYEVASMLFKQCIHFMPGWADVWEGLVFSLVSLGDLSSAFDACKNMIKYDPLSERRWKKVAHLIFYVSDPLFAIEVYMMAMDYDPRVLDLWVNLGSVMYNLGLYPAAFVAYQRAVDLDPTNSKIWSIIGFAFYQLGHFKHGIGACRKSIQLDETNSEVMATLGVCLHNSGDSKGAIESWEQAYKLDPNSSTNIYNMACVHAIQENEEMALEFLSRAIKLDKLLKETASNDPDFDNMRNNPKFLEILDQADE